MNKVQMYVVRVDRNKDHAAWLTMRAKHHEATNNVEQQVYYENQAAELLGGPPNFSLHSGGRGNGACAGLYTAKQINRILGRYAKGAAEAIPVALGYTQAEADTNAETDPDGRE